MVRGKPSRLVSCDVRKCQVLNDALESVDVGVFHEAVRVNGNEDAPVQSFVPTNELKGGRGHDPPRAYRKN